MSKTKKHLYIVTILSIVCILGHILSPPSWSNAHDFLFKFTYFPIILASIWFGRWFSVQLVALFCLVYVFHIVIQLYHHSHHHIFSIVLDLGLYFLVGWITGVLSDSQRLYSQKLSKAYDDLKEKTALLLEFEKNARKTARMNLMGEMASTVAHEVRTPLSGLQGSIEIITSANSTAETKKKFSAIVFKEVERINQVVSSFLALGQENQTKQEPVQFKEVFDDIQLFISPSFAKKRVRLDVNISDNPEVISAKDQLKQIFLNLLMNALNAVDSNTGEVSVISRFENSELVIDVSDNGSGIPEDVQQRLFEPFATGNSSDGSGLGLFISKNLVESFGGTLQLKKTSSAGTEFEVRLKLLQ